MKFELWYPVRPFSLNQPFGSNPDWYARFGMKGHNGDDLAASHGQPVYAPCDGMAWYSTDQYAGDGINIRTKEIYDYKDSGVFFRIVLWHLCRFDDVQFPIKIPSDGSQIEIKTGDLLGYADNTGAPYESTGDHLHVGVHPERQITTPDGKGFGWQDVEAGNGFNGCIDPAPYWNGFYAQDRVQVIANLTAQKTILQKIIDLIKLLIKGR